MVEGEFLVRDQEMTISREEFLRTLPAAIGFGATPPAGMEIEADEIRHRGPARSWRIALTPLPELELGRLALPRLRVRIFLAGYTEADAQRCLDRFDLHFRRGGG